MKEKEKHPDRYNKKGVINPQVTAGLTSTLGLLRNLKSGKINMKKLFACAKTGFTKLSKWQGTNGNHK